MRYVAVNVWKQVWWLSAKTYFEWNYTSRRGCSEESLENVMSSGCNPHTYFLSNTRKKDFRFFNLSLSWDTFFCTTSCFTNSIAVMILSFNCSIFWIPWTYWTSNIALDETWNLVDRHVATHMLNLGWWGNINTRSVTTLKNNKCLELGFGMKTVHILQKTSSTTKNNLDDITKETNGEWIIMHVRNTIQQQSLAF